MHESFLLLLKTLASTLLASALSGVVTISATILPTPINTPGYVPPPNPTTPITSTNTSDAGMMTTVRMDVRSTSIPLIANVISVQESTYTYPWVNTSMPTVVFTFPPNTIGYRLGHNNNPTAAPTRTFVGTITKKIFLTPFLSGTNYIHIQYQTAEGWSTIYHYKIQVDTDVPIVTIAASKISKNNVTFILLTKDATSGIAKTYIRIDGGTVTPVDGLSTFTSSTLLKGKHTATLSAVDFAGNSTANTIAFTVTPKGNLKFNIGSQITKILLSLR